MKWFFALVAAVLLGAVCQLPAQTADDQYLRIYGLIQEGESLSQQGRLSDALSRFIEARTALQRFQKGYPEWSPEVVKFRLDYLGSRITSLSAKVEPAVRPPETAKPAPQVEKPEPNPLEAEVSALKQQVQQLDSDRALLRAKLQEALSAQPAAMDPRELAKADERIRALQKEVELLNASLADAKSAPAAVDPDALAKVQRALDNANRALSEEKERSEQLVKENQTLQAKLRSAGENREIRSLRDENEKLKRELAGAGARPAASKEDAALRRIQELQQESAGLRARLQVFETARVPYTTEELALMRKPPTRLGGDEISVPPAVASTVAPVETPVAAPPRPLQELSPQATTLIAEARRDFSAGQYAKAEEKYRQVLGQAQDHAPALADLATIQMEQGRLDEADKTIQRAAAARPESAHVQSVLGQVRFRQKKYDEALEALGKAAAAEPKNAEIQNWLGVALSEKGHRQQAEAALRKAIQLQPGYAQAHNNLAVVYATQTPPLIELARWHYQKALAGGGGKNAALEKLLDARSQ